VQVERSVGMTWAELPFHNARGSQERVLGFAILTEEGVTAGELTLKSRNQGGMLPDPLQNGSVDADCGFVLSSLTKRSGSFHKRGYSRGR